MLFGQSTASTSFQGYINKILAKKLNIFVIVYLDDILIYIKDKKQGYINAVWGFFEKLKKYNFFANFKKCCFYNNKIRFLKYIVSVQKVPIKDKKIEVSKNWFETKSIRDIWVFLIFANFYQCFIQGFSKIAGSPTLILKKSYITRLLKNLLILLMNVAKSNEAGIGSSGNCENKMIKKLPSKKSNGAIRYLIFKTKVVFT